MRTLAGILLVVGAVSPASGKTVFDPGSDPALHAKMAAHTRVFYAFSARPFGIGLTSEYPDDAALGLIRQFLSQSATEDPKAAVGKHPFEILSSYEGAAGIGLRGGGAAPGTAFRYMALKAEGAPEPVLAPARRDVVRALEAVHVDHVITGIPHGMARGIGRFFTDDPSDPPIPGQHPDIQPLFDEEGKPYPPDPKNNGSDRADNSGGLLPEGMWYWQDSCSKDQLIGWVVAMATLYDAAKDDPAIDQALVERIRKDACEVSAGLRVKHPFVAADGNTYEYDLIIMDADGRPTKHHDLHAAIIDGQFYLPPDTDSLNVFNLVMGLGILKGLYHVCGDEPSEEFLYDELLRRRGWLDAVPDGPGGGVDYVYMGAKTNFSNVNMIAIALFLNLWFESDQVVADRMRAYMEHAWWDPDGVQQAARRAKQPYFHAFYLATTDRGTPPAIAAEAASLLKAFTLDPYTSAERVNCDAEELEKKECIAIDGKTVLELQNETNRGGWPIAKEALDPSIRPPSNFDARSDPFVVNGGGGRAINPGGDLHAAYWLLRWLPERAEGEVARSPNARVHRPVVDLADAAPEPGPDADAPAVQPEDVPAGEAGGDPGAGGGGGSGGCMATGSPGTLPLLAHVLALAWCCKRRRQEAGPAARIV